MSKIGERGNEVKVHLVQGHNDIAGNELPNRQAKKAAVETSSPDIPTLPVLDKREAILEIKKRWQTNGNLNAPVQRRQIIARTSTQK